MHLIDAQTIKILSENCSSESANTLLTCVRRQYPSSSYDWRVKRVWKLTPADVAVRSPPEQMWSLLLSIPVRSAWFPWRVTWSWGQWRRSLAVPASAHPWRWPRWFQGCCSELGLPEWLPLTWRQQRRPGKPCLSACEVVCYLIDRRTMYKFLWWNTGWSQLARQVS